jgi:hypothetical protein
MPELPKSVDFAKQPKPDDTKSVEAIKALVERGVEVYFLDWLKDDKVTWDSVKNNY